MKKSVFILFIFWFSLGFSQKIIVKNNYKDCFKTAYLKNPKIPKGILEAIAWHNTRFAHIDESFAESDIGLPKYWGVMGLVEDGKNYFRENLKLVSKISGFSVDELKHDPCKNILGYAIAFEKIAEQKNINSKNIEDYLPVIVELSELPKSKNLVNDFAMNSFLYTVYKFLSDEDYAQAYGFPKYNVDFEKLFGENLKILSSPEVFIDSNSIYDLQGNFYNNLKEPCPDYNVDNCQWVAADPSNYSSRDGTPISAIVIHTIQGSYAGCISWFQNPDANASAHYVLRSSDGQITQMVREADKAWHVRDENPYTVGYEHEGYIEQQGWYTVPMYQSSANITKHVCAAYGINPHRMFYRDTLDDGTVLDDGVHPLAGDTYCTKIAGHQHYPNNTHTDPGPNWNWNYYYRLVNEGIGDWTTFTTETGTFYDSGGPNGNYSDDERKLYLIKPNNAKKIVLTFNSFDLEANYDFLYIYDGDNEFAPLIGRFNTQSPGTIVSSGNALLVEFRSDCGTTAAGWEASWYSIDPDTVPPQTEITTDLASKWATNNFNAYFNDTDNVEIEKAFYQVIQTDGNNWFANMDNGFFADNFTTFQDFWTVVSGTWTITADGYMYQSDETINNTNIYAPLNQNLSNRYLYEFDAKVEDVGTTRRFGLHFFCDNPSLENRGNSYFIWFRVDDQNLQFYKVENDEFSLVHQVDNIVLTPNVWYNIKVTYDRVLGTIRVYLNNNLIGEYTDPNPYFNGDYVSFRTGNSRIYLSQFKVYRSRYPQVEISVGADQSNDIWVQNFDTATYCAKIKSIVTDAEGNLSEIGFYELWVDYTPPTNINQVIDGLSEDIDITNDNTTISAHWTSSQDPHSLIKNYWVSVGTQPEASDVINWTNVGLDTFVVFNNLDLQANTTYYVNVKAENNAGLQSEISSSDGFVLEGSVYAGFSYSTDQLCSGGKVYFTNESVNANSYKWYFEGGTPNFSTEENPVVQYDNSGIFDVKLVAYSYTDSAVYELQDLINVYSPAVADFYAEQTNLTLDNPVANFVNISENADTYFWNFGDGTTSEDENPSHLYTSTGSFSVSLIASNNGCSDTTLKENYIFVDVANVENFDKINVYPNPFDNQLNITTEEKISAIRLLDITGKPIVSKNIKANQKTIRIDNLTNLKSGIYILEIKTEDQIYLFKLNKN